MLRPLRIAGPRPLPLPERPDAQGSRSSIIGGDRHARDLCQTHRAQLKAILLGWGMPEENAEITSEILSWADLHGVDSHGISMIPGYDGLRRSGRAKMDARPQDRA